GEQGHESHDGGTNILNRISTSLHWAPDRTPTSVPSPRNRAGPPVVPDPIPRLIADAREWCRKREWHRVAPVPLHLCLGGPAARASAEELRRVEDLVGRRRLDGDGLVDVQEVEAALGRLDGQQVRLAHERDVRPAALVVR